MDEPTALSSFVNHSRNSSSVPGLIRDVAFIPKPQMRTYLVVPKDGTPIRVQAEHLNMSILDRSIRLFNGDAAETTTVALFHTQEVVGVIEQDSILAG